MTTLKRLLALLMAAALCLALAACKNTTGEESGAPASSAEVSANPDANPSEEIEIQVDLSQSMYGFSSGLDDSGTAVTVNGSTVPNQLFFYWLSYYCYNTSYYSFFYGMSVDFSDADVQASMIQSTRDAVAYHCVLRELCAAANVTVTDEQREELEGQIAQTGVSVILEEMGLSQEAIETELLKDVDAAIQDNGLDREEVMKAGLESILQNLGVSEENFQYIAENSYLFSNYAEYLMGEATTEKLEQYVEEQGIFAVKHILLQTVDDNMSPLDDSTIAEKKELADDLLAQLQAADDLEATFDELMNEYSEDGGLAANPDGYIFDSTSSLVGGFREAALELEAGEMSGIVETDYGYHIMLRLPVDVSEYEADWYTDGADAVIMEALDAADIVVADEIAALDVNDFYNRYMAYNTELYNSLNPPADDGTTPEEG